MGKRSTCKEEKYYGRMNDCISAAVMKGPCGDEMEVYLDIKDKKITDIKVFTTGCSFTKTCGIVMADLADGKTIYEAMDISAKNVLENCGALPKDHVHCNILAVSVLYKAIAVYLLQK